MARWCTLDERLRDDVLYHMIDRVEAATVEDQPFPHLMIRGLLPREIYSEVLARLPGLSQYETLEGERQGERGAEGSRVRFPLEDRCLDQISPESARFWMSIRSALGAIQLKQALFERLGTGLAVRFGCTPEEAASLPGYARPTLMREFDGAVIPPRTESRRKLVSMQIALPQDGSQESWGTELYRGRLSPLAWLKSPRGFDVAKSLPFLPNMAYAFVVLNSFRCRSWHGRRTPTAGSGIRDCLVNDWFEKSQDGNQDLQAEQRYYAATRAAA